MHQRLPDWIKRGIIDTEKTKFVRRILKKHNLNTVCDSARCPNKGECYAKNTATFMILGKICTRNCRFCSCEAGGKQLRNKNGKFLLEDLSISGSFNGKETEPINCEEPKLVAQAIAELGLNYAVITSVTRDDLPDGGAGHFAGTIQEVKKLTPEVKIEVLTPDFQGNKQSIDKVINAKPDVFNHNIETVKRLYFVARPQANYENSLKFLDYIKEQAPEIYTKSGFMVGLGETVEEIKELLCDLKKHNCDIVTIGQYVQPTKNNLKVEKYYTPQEFENLKQEAIKIGIKHIISSPLARSSYKASEVKIN
ncbi:MAG: lipoyl synthase [bacterium]